MADLFAIDPKDIARLTDRQLVDLLEMLLVLESEKFQLPNPKILVPKNINVADGGEDGRIEWLGTPKETTWLPNTFCLFQCKSGKAMTAKDFVAELFEAPERKHKAQKEKSQAPNPKLKSQIAEVVRRNGAYIFLHSKQLTKTSITPRIKAIREALNANSIELKQIEIYDGNRIAQWVNEHITAAMYVCQCTGQTISSVFQRWIDWSGYDTPILNYVDRDTAQHIVGIKSAILNKNTCIRITGHSGLGKTRLVLEALTEPKCVTERVLYACDSRKQDLLVAEVRQLRRRKQRAILVIDDCSLELHEELVKEVRHSESFLTLITLDFNPDETNASDTRRITLDRSSDDSIRDMVNQMYKNVLPIADIEQIVGFAQGYPQIAVLIAEARINNHESAAVLNDDGLLRKLLGHDANSENRIKALKICSLFSRVGYQDDAVNERILIAKIFGDMEGDTFYEALQPFLSRRILQLRGDYIQVVPLPLALKLSCDYWGATSPEKIQKLMSENLPHKLTSALCEQIKYLHHLPKMHELTKSLCGDQGPFGKAEVLISERGSQLFRTFVEVSPEMTAQAATRALNNLTREQLLAINGEARRNLVRALERLCFWTNQFTKAARLLLRFAAAENETWSNNATGQFIQLFQLMLPGTKASLIERTAILHQEQYSDELERVEVVMKAAANAFEVDHFNRTSGVEAQGGRSIERDYVPQSYQEIYEYWNNCLEVLFSCSKRNELSELGTSLLLSSMLALLKHRQFGSLKKVVEAILAVDSTNWVRVKQKLEFGKKYLKIDLPQEQRLEVESILELLTPDTLSKEIEYWVSKANWDNLEKQEDGSIVDVSEQKAISLGKKCAKSWPQWRLLIPQLTTGPQKNGYVFGKELAVCLDYREIAEAIINTLELEENANPTCLGGLLAGIGEFDRTTVEAVLSKCESSSRLSEFVPYLTQTCRPTPADLKRMEKLIIEGKLAASTARNLVFGQALDHLPPDVILQFCASIATTGDYNTPLSVLYLYCYQNEARWMSAKDVFQNLLLRIDLVELGTTNQTMDLYNWKSVALKLLKMGDVVAISNYIATQAVKVCEQDDSRIFYHLDRTLLEVLRIVVAGAGLTTAWPIIGKALLAEEWRTRFYMETLLTGGIPEPGQSKGIYRDISETFLLDWCESEPGAPESVALLFPVIVPSTIHENVKSSWSISKPIQTLIDKFGTEPNVLDAISKNMGTFISRGSQQPIYAAKIQALETLTAHKHAAVRNWAEDQVAAARAILEKVKKKDEEHDAGIY